MLCMCVLQIPLVNIPVSTSETQKHDSFSSTNFLSTVNNLTLPLAYLDCQDIRVIMPSKDLLGKYVNCILSF